VATSSGAANAAPAAAFATCAAIAIEGASQPPCASTPTPNVATPSSPRVERLEQMQQQLQRQLQVESQPPSEDPDEGRKDTRAGARRGAVAGLGLS